jgi:hypothetical protein
VTQKSNVLPARHAALIASFADRVKKDRRDGLEYDGEALSNLLKEMTDYFSLRVALEVIVMSVGGAPQDNDAGKAAKVLWGWSDNPAPSRRTRRR